MSLENISSYEKNEQLSKWPEKINLLEQPSQDPLIQSWINKIFKKSLDNKVINSLFLDQKKVENISPQNYVQNILDKNPELWFFVSTTLWQNILSKENYQQLSTIEKVKFLGLYQTLTSFFYQKVDSYQTKEWKINLQKFEQAYTNIMDGIEKTLAIDFKLAQLENLWNIQKTLKNTYKFTQKEIDVYVAYLEKMKGNNLQEAWPMWWYIFGLVTWVLLTGAGVYIYNDIIKPKHETLVKTGKVQLWSLRQIARVFSAEADFKTDGYLKKELYERLWNDGWVKDNLKKLANLAQSSEIYMELDGKIGVEFDLDKSVLEYDYDTKKVYVKLQQPKIKVLESNPKILKRNSEVFEIKDFDNIQLELLKDLENQVLTDVSKQYFVLDMARKNTEQILNALLGFSFNLSGQEFNGVEIEIDQSDIKLQWTDK